MLVADAPPEPARRGLLRGRTPVMRREPTRPRVPRQRRCGVHRSTTRSTSIRVRRGCELPARPACRLPRPRRRDRRSASRADARHARRRRGHPGLARRARRIGRPERRGQDLHRAVRPPVGRVLRRGGRSAGAHARPRRQPPRRGRVPCGRRNGRAGAAAARRKRHHLSPRAEHPVRAGFLRTLRRRSADHRACRQAPGRRLLPRRAARDARMGLGRPDWIAEHLRRFVAAAWPTAPRRSHAAPELHHRLDPLALAALNVPGSS